jgi:O-antigen/teichoic acid export membrane protein
MNSKRQFINIVANFAGVGASLALPLIFNVAYYRILGSESYGLIGFYGSLLLVASLLDMGLTQTTVRELARRAADPARTGEMRLVLFTLQFLYCGIGLALGAAIAIPSTWFASTWLQLGQLSTADAASAIAKMGGMLALSFPAILYNATLRGLQRQVLSNAFSITVAACRGVVVLFFLHFYDATPNVFFTVQLSISVVEVLLLGICAWTLLPPSPIPVRFNLAFLNSIWRFSSMNGLAVLIGQLMMMGDRIILSTMLPLKLFGLYSLSVTAASVITKLGGPFSSAYFPHFVELVEQKRHEILSDSYHTVTQFASVVIFSTGVILMMYAREIILLLTNNPDNATLLAPVLTMLAAANTLNALMWLPHTLQLASGVTRFTLQINVVQSIMYLPALIVLVPRYGVYAPPALWLLVNLVNFPIFIALTHRVALHGEAWIWVKDAILIPSLLAVTVIGLGFMVAPAQVSWIITLPWLGANYLLAIIAAAICTPKSNQLIRSQIGRVRQAIG